MSAFHHKRTFATAVGNPEAVGLQTPSSGRSVLSLPGRMWRYGGKPMDELELSIPSERLIGFTVPENNRFLVCDHEEVWRVVVGLSVGVEQTDYAPYEIAERHDFVGWGKADAVPILSFGQRAVSYDFDRSASAAKVLFSDGTTEKKIEFPTFSGDWFGASLSREGRLLVLAEPYRIGLYRMTR